jgi:glycerophosphoryl diester phosphodiesterase
MNAPLPHLPPLIVRRLERDGRPMVSSHRGALVEAPENTLAAFERAYELGAHLVEFDVQQTADGALVVIHDYLLDRTTSGRGPVSDRTLEEVRQLDAGAWFDPRFAGACVPTLAETLDWMRGRVYPILELKQWPAIGLPSLVEPVAAALEQADLVEQTLVLSFDHPALLAMKERLPAVRTAITYEGRLADPIAAARAVRADVVWPSSHFLLGEDVEAIQRAGLAIGCEAHRPVDVERFLEWGLDFVEMDDLAALLQYLGEGRATAT